MAITALPALSRTSATFKTEVDLFMGSQLPTFCTEANALQTDVNAKQATASAAATTATTQAGIATTQAGLATTNGAAQVTLAAAQVTLATTQAGLATTNGAAQVALAADQVTLATTQAGIATTQAGLATTNGAAQVTLAAAQVTLATAQAVASDAARVASETALNNLNHHWLGAKATAPTLDNVGNPLTTGVGYWNTTLSNSYIWDGAAWVIQTYVPTSASGISFVPTGGLASVDAQSAIVELDAEKARLDGSTYTGAQNFVGATVTVADQSLHANTAAPANTKFVKAELDAFQSSTPYSYANRGDLRVLASSAARFAAVEGLGLFYYSAGSIENDDDETCFAATGGNWLLMAMHPDYADAYFAKIAKPSTVVHDFIANFTSTITTVGTNSVASMVITVNGAKLGATVIVKMPASIDAAGTATISLTADCLADQQITVYIRNGANAVGAILGVSGYSARIINP